MSLFYSVLYLVESHVHCLGFSLSNYSIDYTCCSEVVGLDWCSRLRVAHFDEGSAEACSVVGIVEKPSDFGFGGGCHNVPKDVADCVNGSVGWGWMCGDSARVWVTEEEVAADATSCAALGEIRCVAVDPEDHFAGVVADCCIGVACGVVEEPSQGFGCCFGAF
jgi:hypothetical protein